MQQQPETYLDHASGEPLHPAARASLERSWELGFADPRRLHRPARRARLMLDNAREAIADAFGARPDEVVFAPSGTHAVHLGVLGLLEGARNRNDLLLASAVEHSSVLHAGQWHQARGGRTETLPVDRLGRVETAGARERIRDAGVLAVQSANHEVGTLQPVEALAEFADGIPVFVDACASAGRRDLPSGWTAAAASAHKWGGPAGVGVLLVRKGARWRSPFPVDDRAEARSVGMENVPAVLAAAAALQAVVAERDATDVRQRDQISRLREAVGRIPDTDVLGDPLDRLPHLVTFSFLYLAGDAVVDALDRLGFAVASGSACTASTLEPSHVLAAMGALTHGNVRVSVGRDTTDAEIDRLAAALPGVVERLRAEVGL